MKYVALLSGGKDSCFNLLHCARNGHQLVAAASLGPEHGKEELDSYLYQTVGQDAIEFVAQALDVPLYRRVITGTAVNQGSEYGQRQPGNSPSVSGDETEDLYELLVTVKAHHPDLLGVSVGAILSNYQRVRVEHVCRRLGLTALAYLWQRDQDELLAEMIKSGVEAVLIKVAGIGLSTKHLGKTIAELQPTLRKLNTLYGSHICGEGGEYESLTLDLPLYKFRIKLLEVETVIHSDNDFATVAYLRIKKASLEPKAPTPNFTLTVPPILSEAYGEFRQSVEASNTHSPPASATPEALQATVPCSVAVSRGKWLAVANIQRTVNIPHVDVTLEEEVLECFTTLQDRLAGSGLTLSNVASMNVFLSSMDIFTQVNAVYSTFFGTSPPARACVAVDLPPPTRVRIDCIAYAEGDSADRQALHVQGLGYWAPANIGPYSQAITVGENVFISGQIGMLPSTLALPVPPSLALEAALSAQHAARVVEALQNNSGGGWEGCTRAVIYWLVDDNDLARLRSTIQRHGTDAGASLIFLVVHGLPKGALVEKQVIVHTGQCEVPDEDDGTLVRRTVSPTFQSGQSRDLFWEISTIAEAASTVATVFVHTQGHSESLSALQDVTELALLFAEALSIRLFHKTWDTALNAQIETIFTRVGQVPAITPIPCRRIASRTREDWDYAMVIVCVGFPDVRVK